jgi:hypothetical protein
MNMKGVDVFGPHGYGWVIVIFYIIFPLGSFYFMFAVSLFLAGASYFWMIVPIFIHTSYFGTMGYDLWRQMLRICGKGGNRVVPE